MPCSLDRSTADQQDRAKVDPKKVYLAASIAIEYHGPRALEMAEKIHDGLGREFSAAVIQEIKRLTEATFH